MGNLSNLVWIKNREVFIPNIVLPKNWQSGIAVFYKNNSKMNYHSSDSIESVNWILKDA